MAEKTAERTAADALDEASELIREAAHLALREHPTPAEVYRRIGSLQGLVGRLEQHLQSCAGALAKAADNPALRATSDEDPRLLADTAAFRLREISVARYVVGLVSELGMAHGEVSSLFLDEQLADVAGEGDTH